MTEEEKQKRNDTLAKAREAARLNRERRATEGAAASPTSAQAGPALSSQDGLSVEPADARAAPAYAEPAPEIYEAEEIEYFPAPIVAMGGEIAAAAAADPEIEIAPEPETEFDRFLYALDQETRDLLDDAELAEIFEQQKAKARAERRAAAKKAVADRALLHARIGEGLVPAETAADLAWKERMAEQVRFTVDLPDMGDIGLRIDQRIFLHGHSYTVSRAVYESMRSTMYQAQQAELLFEGKDKRHWLRRRARGSVNGHVDMGMAA